MIRLKQDKYENMLPALEKVDFNCLFAKSVAKGQAQGVIYVDKTDSPSNFYVLHSYGMSLLYGDGKNENFNSWLRNYLLNVKGDRTQIEWLQVFPNAWNAKLGFLLNGNLRIKEGVSEIISDNSPFKIIENTRVNFKFNYNLYRLLREKINLGGYNLVETDTDLYEKMNGSVVPKAFWRTAEQFEEAGIGYSLLLDDQLVSTAYSAFIHNGKLELGIETIRAHQGKGLAAICCAALIDYSIATNFEPVWSCRLENTGSYKLAQKLGFEPISYYPYYQVKV